MKTFCTSREWTPKGLRIAAAVAIIALCTLSSARAAAAEGTGSDADVLMFPTASAPGVGEAAPASGAPGLLSRTLRRSDPSFGVDLGGVMATGAIARELDPGFGLRLSTGMDIAELSFLRVELAAAVERMGRSASGASGGLVRTPLSASLLARLPVASLWPSLGDALPAPYVRGGFGFSTAALSGPRREGDFDPAIVAGAGLAYAVGRWWRDPSWGVRLEATFSQQYQDKNGAFAGLMLGVTKNLFADADGDSLVDRDDRCPTLAEDVDGFADSDGCPDLDNDGDSIVDASDLCPNDPEQVDGYDDSDGCPDPDNDDDDIADADDTCPLEAEDMDGFADADGCPDPDNDGDSIADASDSCPLEAEDMDGFADDDGCPDPDNDGDSIADADDACPGDAEDFDQVGDGDGCPDDDYDGDGIADAHDLCPIEAEIINGVEDADGCPDKGPQLVLLTATKIEIKEKVFFTSGSNAISSRSYPMLDQVAAVLRNHQEIRSLRIEGHTDNVGRNDVNARLSQGRADAVRRYLVDKGIAADRLQAVGFGPSQPIAANANAKGRELNRRVEFIIVESATARLP